LFVFSILFASLAHAASGKQPPPASAPAGSPPQFTRFTAKELTRGFLALAFGSDLRLGAKPRGIRRFDGEVGTYVVSAGSVDRTAAMQSIIAEYGNKIPHLSVTPASSEDAADIVVHLIDEKNFENALIDAFGRATARAFVEKTDPQCMTSVKSRGDGTIVRAVSFVIVDKGDRVFRDCAYHEMLHALGLSNHDQSNPWTSLNQNRVVGYLTAYDRALLTLLYDPRIRPGMSRKEVARVLPKLIGALKSRQ
jgi:hypothetical protein